MERPRHRARTLLADIGVGNGCYGILRAIAFHFTQTAAQRPATKNRTDLRRHARTRITNKKLRRFAPRPEIKNIGLLEDKVPMFCLKSTEVCLKEVRCFQFPKPIHPLGKKMMGHTNLLWMTEKVTYGKECVLILRARYSQQVIQPIKYHFI